MHAAQLRHRPAVGTRPAPSSDPHPSLASSREASRQTSRQVSRVGSREPSPEPSIPVTPERPQARPLPASAPAAPRRPLSEGPRRHPEPQVQGLRTPSPVMRRNIAPELALAASPPGSNDSQRTLSVAWGGSRFASPMPTSPGSPHPPTRAPQVSPRGAATGALTPFNPVTVAVSPERQSYLEYSYRSHLAEVAQLRQMAEGGVHTEVRDWLGRPLPRQDLDALFNALVQVTPISLREDWARTRGALEVLLRQQVGPQRLEQLARSASQRDLLRVVPASLLTYACGFMMATLATGWLDPQAAPPAADDGGGAGDAGESGLAAGEAGTRALLAGLLAQGLGDLIIGVGGEWAGAVWRESGLGQAYTRAEGLLPGPDGRRPAFADSEAGRWVQASSAISFAIGYLAHTLAQGALGPARMRLAWGAAAAAVSGLYREGLAGALAPQRDPLWIDGSSHAQRATMTEDLRRLEAPVQSAGEGVLALGRGVARATGLPGREAMARAALRTLAAGCARALGLAARVLGRQHEVLWSLGADAWLGLSWGTLSALPSRGSAWLFQGAGRARGIGAKAGGPSALATPATSVAPRLLTPGDALGR